MSWSLLLSLRTFRVLPSPHLLLGQNRLIGYRAMGGLLQVGFESGIFSPVMTGDSGDGAGDGAGVCFLLHILASDGGEYLQSIPADGSLLLHDVPMDPRPNSE